MLLSELFSVLIIEYVVSGFASSLGQSSNSIFLFSAVGSCDTLSNKGQNGKTTVKIFPKYVHSQVDPWVIEERREGLKSFPSGGDSRSVVGGGQECGG